MIDPELRRQIEAMQAGLGLVTAFLDPRVTADRRRAAVRQLAVTPTDLGELAGGLADFGGVLVAHLAEATDRTPEQVLKDYGTTWAKTLADPNE
jgi:hypothetical protein